MIDGSALSYDENVALTKRVVEYAHQHDVTVEGELGVLAGVEDEVASEVSHYTKPEEVVDFVTKTGVDSLAISIGTSHGAYKFTPRAVHRRSQDGPSGSASPGFRRTGRHREGASGLPHRAARFVVGSPGGSRDDQQVRRCAEGCRGHSRGGASPGRQERRLQDQHRLRLASGHDRRHPRGLRHQTRRVRPRSTWVPPATT